MDDICKQIDELFGNKELTSLLEKTRKSIQLNSSLGEIEDQIEKFLHLIDGSDGEMFFNIDISMDFEEPSDYAYSINTTTKKVHSTFVDTVELTSEEKEEVKKFCRDLFLRHIKVLSKNRNDLLKQLEEIK